MIGLGSVQSLVGTRTALLMNLLKDRARCHDDCSMSPMAGCLAVDKAEHVIFDPPTRHLCVRWQDVEHVRESKGVWSVINLKFACDKNKQTVPGVRYIHGFNDVINLVELQARCDV